tara:strand:+ start:24275 stop:24760 length:486 start_codon:yes stop_codon:yes gene_type:complete
MPSFIKEAQVFTDHAGREHIEIKYTRYIAGEGYKNFAECFDARPISGWINIKSNKESIRYEKFLDTMMEKTIETLRAMATIELDNVLCDNNNIHSIIRIMNSVRILDPTFTAPYINVKCGWQKRLVKSLCQYELPKVIKHCTDENRLERMFNVLRLIESET